MESELMADWSDYKREADDNSGVVGKQRCVITDVEETESKTSHKPMLVISVRPSGCRFTVKTYIVKNEYFNRNMTQFFDSFVEIGDGNFSFMEWIGAEGGALFETDDAGYLRVKRFLSPMQIENLPPFEGDKPERQTVTTLDDAEPDDEFPFT